MGKPFDRIPRLRLYLAIAVLLLLIPTWLVVSGMVIMLGCALWVVSLLLIMSEDLASLKMIVLTKQKSLE